MSRAAMAALGLLLNLGAGWAAADVVVVVSARSPVSALTKNQIADIFLGKAGRFPDGTPAVPIDLAEGTPARDEFYSYFASKSTAQVKAHWSKVIFTGRGQPPREAPNGAAMKKSIAENPDAIGYMDHSQVDSTVKVLVAP